MKRVSISISTNSVCGTEIIVNGKLLDGVKEFHFSQKAGEPPQFIVSLQATDVMVNDCPPMHPWCRSTTL